MKRWTLLYIVIAAIVAVINAFYLEPKPIVTIGHMGLVTATAFGYMLGSYIVGAIVLLILMIFIKSIRKEFWNLSFLIMMGIVILKCLADIFG